MIKKKDQIIEDFRNKLRELKDHNKYYFKDDSPKISDSEYDKLKNEILKLENKYSYLRLEGSASSLVGSTPSNKFKKVKHLKPMLSLSNAFDKNDMNDFLKKIRNF